MKQNKMIEPERGEIKRVPFYRRIGVRFLLSYLLLIAGVLIVLNTYPIYTAQNSVFHMKQSAVQNQASVVASAISGLGTLNEDDVEQVVSQLDTSAISRLIITDEAAKALFDTSENENCVGSYVLLSEVVQALRGNDVFHSDYTQDAFRSRAAVPVIYRGVLIGCVYVYEYDSDQAALLNGLRQNLTRLSVAVLIAAVAVSLVISQSITRKIAKLLKGIQRTGSGGESQKVEVGGHDEITVLAEEFNHLTDRLEENETVRRRFVSDASHELKTPLASIRLLTDSILQTDDIDAETMREFVVDIGDEAERLTRITEKLLALTRLDAGAMSQRSVVNLGDTVERVRHMLAPLAEERSVELVTDIQSEGRMEADADDLYQIVFNLAENGIKYNVPGGRVCIAVRERPNAVLLQVEDTGIGIPKEELPKVFDRFYRVDKARSRAAGGTGLGLSIVKDMVTRYGGDITASQREGGGSVFCVTFPGEVRE